MASVMTRGLEPSDQELIARWRAGDESAAAALVHRHARAVGRFVVSQGQTEPVEVEELVQDTFVRAFASLDGFRGESALRTWLLAIARNLVRDRARAARTARQVVELQEGHAVEEHDALDRVVAAETAVRVGSALERLTPMQRSVFHLRVTEGLSYREIAATLDTTEGAARVHYHNAMRSVKEYLHD